MANQEHVDLLRHGIAEWNQWKNAHLETRPDLSGANLSGANLSGAHLMRADLIGALLIRADLSGADLREANFSGADLTGAHLSEADLRDTIFNGANLSRADLRGAILILADLSGADLSETDLTGADLSGAHLMRLDLRSTKGLIEVNHRGPSYIELHSIQLPQDGSALCFLRDVGVPDEWIDFYQATMMQPIQYYSIFISYASADEAIAKRLHADLQANGVRCWFAPHDLKPGDYFREKIDKAIHLQEKLLLILSKYSVVSKWVRYEVSRARNREAQQERTILFPIRLDDTVLHYASGWAADLRTHRHIGDFTGWQEHAKYQEAFTQLLKHLKAETK